MTIPGEGLEYGLVEDPPGDADISWFIISPGQEFEYEWVSIPDIPLSERSVMRLFIEEHET